MAYKKPDIVILNETWLKENIGSKEIFPFPNYKIFRLDRSPYSHPPDKNDKHKFKSNGGSVLIAVNTDVVTNPKIVKSNFHAEVLSISLGVKNYVSQHVIGLVPSVNIILLRSVNMLI